MALSAVIQFEHVQTNDANLAYQKRDCPTGKIREWLASPNLDDEFAPLESPSGYFVRGGEEGWRPLPLHLPLERTDGRLFLRRSRGW